MTLKTFQFKPVAFLLCLLFCTPSGYALPSTGTVSEVSLPQEKTDFLFSLPSENGTLEEFNPGTSLGRPFLIHIQDLHTNPETQQNIRLILHWIAKNLDGAKWKVAVEGATGPLHPEYLDFFKGRPSINAAIVSDLASKGELSGAELFALDQKLVSKDQTVPVEGVEDAALYTEDLRIYRTLLANRPKIENFLTSLQKDLDVLESQVFSPELRNFFKERERRKEGDYGAGPISPQIISYIDFLADIVRSKLGIDLNQRIEQLRYPQLSRVLALNAVEAKVQPEQALKEQRSLFEMLRKNGLDENGKAVLSAIENSKGSLSRVQMEKLAVLVQDRGLRLQDFPEFSKQAGVGVLNSELKGDILFKEMEELESLAISKMAVSPREKELVGLLHNFSMLGKLLKLQLTRDDYQAFKSLKETPSPLNLRTRALALHAALNKRKDNAPAFFVPSFAARFYWTAVRFYQIAALRDQSLHDRTVQSGEGAAAIVLISGGFHSEGLVSQLKQQGNGYAVIRPRTAHHDENLSDRVYRGDNADTAKYFSSRVLNKQERIFFKEMIETGIPRIRDEEKADLNHAGEIFRESLAAHPVLAKKITAEILPVSSEKLELKVRAGELKNTIVSFEPVTAKAVAAALLTQEYFPQLERLSRGEEAVDFSLASQGNAVSLETLSRAESRSLADAMSAQRLFELTTEYGMEEITAGTEPALHERLYGSFTGKRAIGYSIDSFFMREVVGIIHRFSTDVLPRLMNGYGSNAISAHLRLGYVGLEGAPVDPRMASYFSDKAVKLNAPFRGRHNDTDRVVKSYPYVDPEMLRVIGLLEKIKNQPRQRYRTIQNLAKEIGALFWTKRGDDERQRLQGRLQEVLLSVLGNSDWIFHYTSEYGDKNIVRERNELDSFIRTAKAAHSRNGKPVVLFTFLQDGKFYRDKHDEPLELHNQQLAYLKKMQERNEITFFDLQDKNSPKYSTEPPATGVTVINFPSLPSFTFNRLYALSKLAVVAGDMGLRYMVTLPGMQIGPVPLFFPHLSGQRDMTKEFVAKLSPKSRDSAVVRAYEELVRAYFDLQDPEVHPAVPDAYDDFETRLLPLLLANADLHEQHLNAVALLGDGRKNMFNYLLRVSQAIDEAVAGSRSVSSVLADIRSNDPTRFVPPDGLKINSKARLDEHNLFIFFNRIVTGFGDAVFLAQILNSIAETKIRLNDQVFVLLTDTSMEELTEGMAKYQLVSEGTNASIDKLVFVLITQEGDAQPEVHFLRVKPGAEPMNEIYKRLHPRNETRAVSSAPDPMGEVGFYYGAARAESRAEDSGSGITSVSGRPSEVRSIVPIDTRQEQIQGFLDEGESGAKKILKLYVDALRINPNAHSGLKVIKRAQGEEAAREIKDRVKRYLTPQGGLGAARRYQAALRADDLIERYDFDEKRIRYDLERGNQAPAVLSEYGQLAHSLEPEKRQQADELLALVVYLRDLALIDPDNVYSRDYRATESGQFGTNLYKAANYVIESIRAESPSVKAIGAKPDKPTVVFLGSSDSSLVTAGVIARKANVRILGGESAVSQFEAMARTKSYEPGIQSLLEAPRSSGDLNVIEDSEGNLEEGIRQSRVIFIDADDPGDRDPMEYFRNVSDLAERAAGVLKRLRAEGDNEYRVFVFRGTFAVGNSRDLRDNIASVTKDNNFGVAFLVDFTRRGNTDDDVVAKNQVVFGLSNINVPSDRKPEALAGNKIRETLQGIADVLSEGPSDTRKQVTWISLDAAEAAMQAFLMALILKLGLVNAFGPVVSKGGGRLIEAAMVAGLDSRIGQHMTTPSMSIGGRLMQQIKFLQRVYGQKAGNTITTKQELLEELQDLRAALKRPHLNDKRFLDQNYLTMLYLSALIIGDAQNLAYFQEQTRGAYAQMKRKTNGYRLGDEKPTVAIIGVAYKDGTDQITESSALKMIKWLVEEQGVKSFRIYDPLAVEAVKKWFEQKRANPRYRGVEIEYFTDDPLEAMKNSQIVMFTSPLEKIKQLPVDKIKGTIGEALLVDGVNIYGIHEHEKSEAGTLTDVNKNQLNYLAYGSPATGPAFPGRKVKSFVIPKDADLAAFNVSQDPLKITFFGGGYVGGVSSAILADQGHQVTLIDVIPRVIESLRKRETHIVEKGLAELLERNVNIEHPEQGNLQFALNSKNPALSLATTEITPEAKEAVLKSRVLYMAVNTPQGQQGRVDLGFIETVTRQIGVALTDADDPRATPAERQKEENRRLIVIKSTVPPVAFDEVEKILDREFGLINGLDYMLASNPEFLVEGDAVRGNLEPGRTVFGIRAPKDPRLRDASNELAVTLLLQVWQRVRKNWPHPIFITSEQSSTTGKYLGNSTLALHVSLANLVAYNAEISKTYYRWIENVLRGDFRISPKAHLECGPGYGGHCFPKDLRAEDDQARTLIAQDQGIYLIQVTDIINEIVRRRPIFSIAEHFEGQSAKGYQPLRGKKIGILGAAFKEDTGDMRESPALINAIESALMGAETIVSDINFTNPRSIEEAKKEIVRLFIQQYGENYEFRHQFGIGLEDQTADSEERERRKQKTFEAISTFFFNPNPYFSGAGAQLARITFVDKPETVLTTTDAVINFGKDNAYKALDISKLKRADSGGVRKVVLADERGIWDTEHLEQLGLFSIGMGRPAVGEPFFDQGGKSEARSVVLQDLKNEAFGKSTAELTGLFAEKVIPQQPLDWDGLYKAYPQTRSESRIAQITGGFYGPELFQQLPENIALQFLRLLLAPQSSEAASQIRQLIRDTMPTYGDLLLNKTELPVHLVASDLKGMPKEAIVALLAVFGPQDRLTLVENVSAEEAAARLKAFKALAIRDYKLPETAAAALDIVAGGADGASLMDGVTRNISRRSTSNIGILSWSQDFLKKLGYVRETQRLYAGTLDEEVAVIMAGVLLKAVLLKNKLQDNYTIYDLQKDFGRDFDVNRFVTEIQSLVRAIKHISTQA